MHNCSTIKQNAIVSSTAVASKAPRKCDAPTMQLITLKCCHMQLTYDTNIRSKCSWLSREPQCCSICGPLCASTYHANALTALGSELATAAYATDK